MIIYISGPMTGKLFLNYLAFRKAEKELRKKGHTTMNPHVLGKHVRLSTATGQKPDYDDFLSYDLEEMQKCEKVYFLKGWRKSFGCNEEYKLAKIRGMECYFQAIGEDDNDSNNINI